MDLKSRYKESERLYKSGLIEIGKTILYLPENINLENLLYNKNRDLKLLPQYSWFINLIVSRTVENKHEASKKGGWISINRKNVEGYIQSNDVTKIKNDLIEWGIIETDNKSLYGFCKRHNNNKSKSFYYRLTDRYKHTGIKQVVYENHRIWFYKNLFENEQNNIINNNPKLKELFDYYTNLEYDLEGAKKYIEKCKRKGFWIPINQKDVREEFKTSQYNHSLLILKRIENKDLYFKVSPNTGRVYTVITNMPKRLRRFLKINNEEIKEIDMCAAHPNFFYSLAENLLDKKKYQKSIDEFEFLGNNDSWDKIHQDFGFHDINDFIKYMNKNQKHDYDKFDLSELLKNIDLKTKSFHKKEFLKDYNPFIKNKVLKNEKTKMDNNYINMVYPFYRIMNEMFTKKALIKKHFNLNNNILFQNEIKLNDIIYKTININPFELEWKDFEKKRRFLKIKSWYEKILINRLNISKKDFNILLKGEKKQAKIIFEKFQVNKVFENDNSWILNHTYDYVIRNSFERILIDRLGLSPYNVHRLDFNKDIIPVLISLYSFKEMPLKSNSIDYILYKSLYNYFDIDSDSSFISIHKEVILSINILINTEINKSIELQLNHEYNITEFIRKNDMLYEYMAYTYSKNNKNWNNKHKNKIRTSFKIGFLSSLMAKYGVFKNKRFTNSFSINNPNHFILQQFSKIFGVSFSNVLQKKESDIFINNININQKRYTVHDSILVPKSFEEKDLFLNEI